MIFTWKKSQLDTSNCDKKTTGETPLINPLLKKKDYKDNIQITQLSQFVFESSATLSTRLHLGTDQSRS